MYARKHWVAKRSCCCTTTPLNEKILVASCRCQFQAALDDLPELAGGRGVVGASFGHAKHNFGLGKAKTAANGDGMRLGSLQGMAGLAASQVDALGALARAAGRDNSKQRGEKSSDSGSSSSSSSKVRPPPSSPESLFERFAGN